MLPGSLLGEQVFGGNTPAGSPAGIQALTQYPALVLNNANPVTVYGAVTQIAPYSVLGGAGGITFYGGASTLGGSLYLGGGHNFVSGWGPGIPTNDATNGGLTGDWLIATGGTTAADGDIIRLAYGNDTVFTGANDTVAAGGANVLLSANDSGPLTAFLGTGNSTVFGNQGTGDLVFGGAGNAVIVGGTGGNNTIVAGTGNTTLIGGGNGDLLFGNATGSDMFFASGNETLLGGGSSSDTFFGFSGISSTGNAFMTAANGTGDNSFWAGAGNDTIWTGMGHDTIFVFGDHTRTSGAPAQHLIFGFNANSTLWIGGYTAASFGMAAAGVTLNLSDGTELTFAGIGDASTIRIV